MISQILFLVILILLNAYFAATEIAFISLNDAKIEKMSKEGNKKAKQITKMLKKPKQVFGNYSDRNNFGRIFI